MERDLKHMLPMDRVQVSMDAQRRAWEHRMEPIFREEKSQCAKDQEVRTSCE